MRKKFLDFDGLVVVLDLDETLFHSHAVRRPTIDDISSDEESEDSDDDDLTPDCISDSIAPSSTAAPLTPTSIPSSPLSSSSCDDLLKRCDFSMTELSGYYNYACWIRPGVTEFLNSLFQMQDAGRIKLCVWTAATEDYCDEVCDKLFGKRKNDLALIWSISELLDSGAKFMPKMAHALGVDVSQTILIDDKSENFEGFSGILCKPFSVEPSVAYDKATRSFLEGGYAEDSAELPRILKMVQTVSVEIHKSSEDIRVSKPSVTVKNNNNVLLDGKKTKSFKKQQQLSQSALILVRHSAMIKSF